MPGYYKGFLLTHTQVDLMVKIIDDEITIVDKRLQTARVENRIDEAIDLSKYTAELTILRETIRLSHQKFFT